MGTSSTTDALCCRGDAKLGTACGQCPRCKAQQPDSDFFILLVALSEARQTVQGAVKVMKHRLGYEKALTEAIDRLYLDFEGVRDAAIVAAYDSEDLQWAP